MFIRVSNYVNFINLKVIQQNCIDVPDESHEQFLHILLIIIKNHQEEALSEVQTTIDTETTPDNTSVINLKSALETTSNACAAYVRHMTKAAPIGNTKLDRERQKMCLFEIVSEIHL